MPEGQMDPASGVHAPQIFDPFSFMACTEALDAQVGAS
jgi:hypothetical protein